MVRIKKMWYCLKYKIIDVIWITTNIMIIILLIIVYPICSENKKLFEQCDYKILCQKGLIDDPICKQYQNIPDSINITTGTTIR